MNSILTALQKDGFWKTKDQELIEESKWLGYLVIEDTIFNIMVEKYEEREYTIATELLDMNMTKSYNEYTN